MTTKIVDDENVIFQINNITIEIGFSFINRLIEYNKYFHYNLMS